MQNILPESNDSHQLSPSEKPLAINVLRSQNIPMRKRIVVDGKGDKIKTEPYPKAKHFKAHSKVCENFADLSDLLEQLATTELGTNGFVINGAPQWNKGVSRRRNETINTRRIQWLPVDVDKIEVKEPFDPATITADQIENLLDEVLRSVKLNDCLGISCIWQWTASAYHSAKVGQVSARLWFKLSEPVELSRVKAWADSKAIDTSVYSPIQAVYTCPPEYVQHDTGEVLPDFIPQRTHFIEGMLGDDTPVGEILTFEPEIKKTYDAKGATEKALQKSELILAALHEQGRYKADLGNGKHAIECPNSENHTTESNVDSTVFLEVGYEGNSGIGFKCKHAHCAKIKTKNLISALGLREQFNEIDNPPSEMFKEFIDDIPNYEDRTVHTETPAANDSDKTKRLLIPAMDTQQNLQPPSWLIQNVIETKTLSMVYGESGAGKSFVTLDMACCIASGKDWHGHETKAGAVAYVAGEGIGGMKRRVAGWMKEYGKPENLYLSSRGLSLPDKNLMQELDGIANLELVILDTLYQTLQGDVNSSKDAPEYLRHAQDIVDRYDCTVLIVHHVGHATKDRGAGHHSLIGNVDSRFLLEKGIGDNQVRLVNQKQKDSEQGAEVTLTREVIDITDRITWGNAPQEKTTTCIMRHLDAELFEFAEEIKKVKGEVLRKIFAAVLELQGGESVLTREVLRAHCEENQLCTTKQFNDRINTKLIGGGLLNEDSTGAIRVCDDWSL